ncbi:MAG: YfiT family bacillithiol transferase [Chitinophagaceae bacterium]
MDTDYSLRYPMGKLQDQRLTGEEPFSEQIKKAHILDIKFLPSLLENAVLNLDAAQLHTPYRPGGWTIHQVVHHVPDSHLNAYTRFKLALTENNPVIKPYDEAAWAELSDTRNLPINISLTLLHALHTRWVELLNNISEEEWNKTVFHPEHKRNISLWHFLATYAWHGKHHVAHITSLRERMKW